jgi:hypothetical protein
LIVGYSWTARIVEPASWTAVPCRSRDPSPDQADTSRSLTSATASGASGVSYTITEPASPSILVVAPSECCRLLLDDLALDPDDLEGLVSRLELGEVMRRAPIGNVIHAGPRGVGVRRPKEI